MEEEIQQHKNSYTKTPHGKFSTQPLKAEMTLDEAYDFLEVQKDAPSSEYYEQQVDKSNLEHITQKVKKAEAKYFAFLNKEFNILNRKMIKCSIYCYDSPDVNCWLTF
jgi:hypothetical protein